MPITSLMDLDKDFLTSLVYLGAVLREPSVVEEARNTAITQRDEIWVSYCRIHIFITF